MKTFSYNAARGQVGVICKSSGLVEAIYTGPLCAKSFNALRGEMLETKNGAGASVIRLDKSLILEMSLPELPPGMLDVAPACLIVRRNQYAIFQDYANRLSKQGVIRLVFVEGYAHLAYQWALKRCAERLAQ